MFSDLTTACRPAIVMTILFAILLGVIYPTALVGIAQLLAPEAANGSLLRDAKGGVIGSSLIGQSFKDPRYFHGRPSAAGKGYDAAGSSGSNLGPASKALADRLRNDIAIAPPLPGRSVPADLVTTSASGLDPDISPEAALYQVTRVAAARKIDAAKLRNLVEQNTASPLFHVIGEPRVNVVALNLALDRMSVRP